MMELIPNSGVYVYPRDIRIAHNKGYGTAMARYLMSVFYTTQEMVERVNLMGENGKSGLDRKIVEAIVGKELGLNEFSYND
jgi:hypothetical protein